MRPPVVVDYQGDVVVFSSVEEAERYIEPQDARSGACVVFDGGGRRLRPVIAKHLLAERVKLEPSPGDEDQRDELRRILIRFLSRAGSGLGGQALEERSLEDLLSVALRFKAQ